ncbi:hypothetical protein FBBAL38_11749 [Flavobacteria bacterium BAL38]|nr:hypothetical protein FBBAL38_11749 [Flavobacteria bacterium BAL38]
MATIFTVNAQDKKPTKEETIAFINRTIELSIGSEYNYTYTTKTYFDYNIYERESVMKVGELVTGNFKEEYSLLKWENLRINSFHLQNCSFGENDICQVWIYFSNQISFRETSTEKYGDPSDKITFKQSLAMLIPKGKFESIKKACIRLSEIAKEENKDPFKD